MCFGHCNTSGPQESQLVLGWAHLGPLTCMWEGAQPGASGLLSPCKFRQAEPEAGTMLPFLTLVCGFTVGQGQGWDCLPSGSIVGGPGSRIVNVNEAGSQTSSFFSEPRCTQAWTGSCQWL